MVKYNLEHLTQDNNQRVFGPIQDDEALFLYSIVRGMRLSRILEIGGLTGYSAQNFLAAMTNHDDSIMYTVDLYVVPTLANNHKVIVKNALHLTMDDVDNKPLDLVFFDCHDMVQMNIYENFVQSGIITDDTVIALHDTNLHYHPFQVCGPYVHEEGGYAHQPIERFMVGRFKDMGYDAFCLHTTADKHNESFPLRHGITICKKYKKLH